MDFNLLQWHRYLRVLSGILLLSYAFAGGPVWAYVGFFPLITGAIAFCPVIALIKPE